MPTIESFRERLDSIGKQSIEPGSKDVLRKLCELGLEYHRFGGPSGPSESIKAYHFKDALCGRVAEVLGLDTDTEFCLDDYQHFLDQLNAGLEIEAIADAFSPVSK